MTQAAPTRRELLALLAILTLAALIVSRVSGMSFPRFTAERLFKPAGMINTGWRDDFRALMQADDLTFKDGSIDLLTMIRVMHHLPDPSGEFNEISRVLSPSG